MPIIAGVVALLVIAGGAALYFSKNMTKDTPAVTAQQQTQQPENGADIAAAGTPAQTSPPASAEETREAEAAAASFEGVTVEPGNPVVATVDGRDITRVDVFRYIKMMPANIQQLPPQTVYPLALDQVISTRLVQNKAEEAGLENDPEVLEQTNMAKQQILRTVFVQRAVDKVISQSDIKKKYDEVIGKAPTIEEIKASHILVGSEGQAKDLIEKLKGGADFAKLAAEFSADTGNKDQGGDLGWFAKQDMVPEFADAAFALGKGKLSEQPVQTEFGWHVVKVEDKRNRPKPSLEEVAPMIQAELRRERLESMLENWMKTASVERFDINGKPLAESDEVAPAAGNNDAGADAQLAEPDAAAAPDVSAE
ncbi:MAG: peptidylprolyl isomerase [Micavibrio sp.]